MEFFAVSIAVNAYFNGANSYTNFVVACCIFFYKRLFLEKKSIAKNMLV